MPRELRTNPLLCCPHDAQIDVSAARRAGSSSSALECTTAHFTHIAQVYNLTVGISFGLCQLERPICCVVTASGSPTMQCTHQVLLCGFVKARRRGQLLRCRTSIIELQPPFPEVRHALRRLSTNCYDVACQGLRLVEAHLQLTTRLRMPATVGQTPCECFVLLQQLSGVSLDSISEQLLKCKRTSARRALPQQHEWMQYCRQSRSFACLSPLDHLGHFQTLLTFAKPVYASRRPSALLLGSAAICYACCAGC
jgi:hypothetical protein